ncbi:MAG: hypothetical protein JST00_21245 [Deltaproteobacteria bacterium]|nr:hypothetical protein [Deltaproteobacteria bacterium]
MNRAPFVALSLALAVSPLLVACGGAPSVGTTTPSAADVPPPVAKEDARPKADAKERDAIGPAEKESLDPLSVGGSLESAAIPSIVKTPAKELRPLSRGDLDAALKVLDGAGSHEAALKKLVARLGKPTWTENDKKRVWIAKDGKSCHRFVFDNDGQADIETAPVAEWRMLSAMARQNACTGEIKKGDLGGN